MAMYGGFMGAQTDTLSLGRINDASNALRKHLIWSVSNNYNHLRMARELAIARKRLLRDYWAMAHCPRQ